MKTTLLTSLLITGALALHAAEAPVGWKKAQTAAFGAGLNPVELRCEYRTDPLGIDVVEPGLSWELVSERRGQMQAAYQILVASSPQKLAEDQGDLWDSGKVESDEQLHVAYQGKPLAARQYAYWKVKVWPALSEVEGDKDGTASDWSRPAQWSMGLLKPEDWGGAKWIGAVADPLPPHNGYHSQLANSEDAEKWVTVDLGEVRKIDGVRLFPARPFDVKPDTPGFLFPVRFKVEVALKEDFSDAKTVVDCTDKDGKNPGHSMPAYRFEPTEARYVRMTATKLAPYFRDQNKFGFALAELQVYSGYRNVALGAPVSVLDSNQRPPSWKKENLTDGHIAGYSGEGNVSDPSQKAAVMLRREVDLSKQPVRAVATISGLGYYELTINGNKAGDHELDPGFTTYDQRVLYVTHDVTSLFKPGANAIGVVLGNGWFNQFIPEPYDYHTATWSAPPKLLLRIDVNYADGSTETIVSDESWKVSTDGPIRYNNLRGGETIDARKAMPGWDRQGFDDASWTSARSVPAPGGKLQAQSLPPVRVTGTVKPVAVTEPKQGVYVFDLGVNIAGWPRLATRGERGQEVTIVAGETVSPEGLVETYVPSLFNYDGRCQTGVLILSGQGQEVFDPRFYFTGFRYVQVAGLTEKPDLDSLVGVSVHTDPEPAGAFACSNEDVNRIHEMILRTQLCNLHHVPEDCPTREKQGWTGDGDITVEEAIFNLRMPLFYWKWFRDMLDVQDDNGHAAAMAPTPSSWGRSQPNGKPHIISDPWWGGAIVRLPWKHYQYYGDIRILEEAYEPMKKYMAYVATQSPGQISWGNEGDWLEAGGVTGRSKRTPVQFAGTAAYCLHAKTVARIARLLGKENEAAEYDRLAETISAALNKKYFDPATGLYGKDSQTAQAMPLYFGMTPADKRNLVLKRLVENITEVRKNHVSTGIIGTYYLFMCLKDEGHDELAFTLLTRKGEPGWMHMLHNGATTLWENWDAKGAYTSRNHPALGSIDSWLYQAPGGIRLKPASPAFKDFVIKPSIVGDLTWVKCAHRSLRGEIVSNWKLEGGKIRMEVAIPANTTATVFVPTMDAKAVMESGKPAAGAEGVRFLEASGESAQFKVGSGRYVFEAPFERPAAK